MKDNRIYNISFDLHTVSGIVISVLLYVIFFAGTFSFFRDEIVNWERNEPLNVGAGLHLDIDAVLDSLKGKYNLNDRDVSFRRYSDERMVAVNISDSRNKADSVKGGFYFMDTQTYQLRTYAEAYTLGEFLYRLHFFAQNPYPIGYYLSGLTALFFLFAIVTGIIVHWKKIISNFYVFRPWAKLKTVWTDAHTVLGTIGIPFQAVYAVTGAYFMIRVFLLIPTVIFMYHGDTEKIYEDLGVELPHYDHAGKSLNATFAINPLVEKTTARWEDFAVTQVDISNYGDSNMHVAVMGELDRSVRFTGAGQVVYHMPDGQAGDIKDPYNDITYVDGVVNTLTRLHYADYAGYALRIISFVLGLITCFVILSGILLWLEARNKQSIPAKKRRFNERVGHIYLAFCLSMYPVTALTFIVAKLAPLDAGRQSIIYSVYFITWLVLTVFFTIRKDNYFTNRLTLILGAVLGAVIPVVSGLTTGRWIWISLIEGQYDLFVVDAMWVSLTILAVYALSKLKRKASSVSHRELEPEAVSV
jgi:uncharacterized iron-regulated membrane protein